MAPQTAPPALAGDSGDNSQTQQASWHDDAAVYRCEYNLGCPQQQHLEESSAAGVDLTSSKCDETFLDVFDGHHLEAAQNMADSSALEPLKSTDDRLSLENTHKRLRLPSGSGAEWSKLPSETLAAAVSFTYGAKSAPPAPSVAPGFTAPTPGSKAQLRKEKGLKPSRRGKNSSRKRGGKFLKAAGGDSYVADTERLRAKFIKNGLVFHDRPYIAKNGAHVSTGTQGLNPPRLAGADIKMLDATGNINASSESPSKPASADLHGPVASLGSAEGVGVGPSTRSRATRPRDEDSEGALVEQPAKKTKI